MTPELTLALLKLGLVLVLSSFMGATAVTFLKVRLDKKAREYSHLLRIMGVGDAEAERASSALEDEFAAPDYVLPTLFASLVSIAGFTALVFGRELVTVNEGQTNFLLTGGVTAAPAQMQEMRVRAMTMLTFGFVGAFVWSARHIVRRLMNGDLTPNTYYSAALRIVFASLLALMLSFVLGASPAGAIAAGALPAVVFIAGMLPDETFVYLRHKVGIFKTEVDAAAPELPLEMIEGINAFSKTRLAEVDVDDVQNLAEANLVELLLKTPFSAYKLVDWIAQAKLVLCFGHDVTKLRKLRIRTILDLRQAAFDGQDGALIAEETGMSALSLRLVSQRVQTDPTVARLQEFKDALSRREGTVAIPMQRIA
jgi:hypothetical protein